MSVKEGNVIPHFSLPNQDGELVSLADFTGKHIVLYFYPKDMTPGCTTEACDFRDAEADFKDLNAVILGVSPDEAKSHQKFIAKHDLPFELLVDENRELAELFDVWRLKKSFGKEYYGIERSTFIIDKEGILRKVYRKVRVKDHVNTALTFIKENL